MVQPADSFDKNSRMFLTSGVASFFGYAFLAVQREVAGRRMAGSHFLVGFGIGGSRLWARIHTPLKNGKAFGSLRDLKKTEEVVSRVKETEGEISDVHNKPRWVVSVVFEETVVDGEPVYRLELRRSDVVGLAR